MDTQMTIFDFLQPNISDANNLDNLPEAEMVKMIMAATGLDFEYRDDFWRYEAKRKGVKYEVGYSNYQLDDNHKRFISCGYGNNKGGSGSPCDTVQEAISFFQRALARGGV